MATNREALRTSGRNMRKSTNGRRVQTIYSEPQWLLSGKYLTEKGKRLLQTRQISEKEAWGKYGKNRYHINPNARPLKRIVHID